MSEFFAGVPWQHLAARLLKNSLGLRRGQNVIINTWTHTLRAAETIAVEARRLGIRPFLLHMTESAFYEAQAVASPRDANALSEAEWASVAAADGYIFIPPDIEDLRRRDRLPAAHRRALEQSREDWHRVLVRHRVPSVYLIGATTTEAMAREFGVNLHSWRQETLRACAIPSSRLRREANLIAQRLIRGRRITLTHPNGTRLELGLAGRTPHIDDGAVDTGESGGGGLATIFPGGYLSVALDEKVAEGVFVANRPSRSRHGPILGMRWTFRNGRLAGYDAKAGRAIFEHAYGHGGRERDRPAVLEIGLNPATHDFPLAEDQEQGVVTVEIGHNDDFGGRTRGTFRQFAMIRGADLSVDDRLLLRAGRRI
jgi:leucyl aminopeptidase (aminopeptidase T)